MEKSDNKLSIALLVVGVLLLVGGGVYYFMGQQKYSENKDTYDAIAESYVEPAQPAVVQDKNESVSESTQEAAESPFATVDWDGLKQANSEIVGWISMSGTPIDYPVTQHGDNAYYLDHMFTGAYNVYGAPFMAYDNASDISDDSTFIFGHHLKNGEMFAYLADLSDQEKFDEAVNNTVLTYQTPEMNYVLEPVFCYVTKGDDESVLIDNFEADGLEDYVASKLEVASAKNSEYDAASIGESGKIISLLTCSYNETDDRTILVCVIKDSQEVGQ